MAENSGKHLFTHILLGLLLGVITAIGVFIYINKDDKVIIQTGDDPILKQAIDSVEQVNRGLLQGRADDKRVIDSLSDRADSIELTYRRDKEARKEVAKQFEVKKEAVKTITANGNLDLLKAHLKK